MSGQDRMACLNGEYIRSRMRANTGLMSSGCAFHTAHGRLKNNYLSNCFSFLSQMCSHVMQLNFRNAKFVIKSLILPPISIKCDLVQKLVCFQFLLMKIYSAWACAFACCEAAAIPAGWQLLADDGGTRIYMSDDRVRGVTVSVTRYHGSIDPDDSWGWYGEKVECSPSNIPSYARVVVDCRSGQDAFSVYYYVRGDNLLAAATINGADEGDVMAILSDTPEMKSLWQRSGR